MTRNEILEVINNFYKTASEREVAFARAILKAKEWIGLTDEEIDACFEDGRWSLSEMYYPVVRAIESALKEKNSG